MLRFSGLHPARRFPTSGWHSLTLEVFMSAGIAVAPVQPNPQNQAVLEQKLRLQARVRSGAGWLAAIALFSVVNSALTFFDASLHFIVGLGVTQIADGMGKIGGTAGSVAGFVVSLLAAGVFLVFWKFARAGQQWAYITPMILYGLDGLIFLGFGLWLDFGFHIFALYSMYKGLSALSALNQLNRQQPAGYVAGQTLAR
jgi:hypothetical protein